MNIKTLALALMVAAASFASLGTSAKAATAEDLNREGRTALQNLYSTNPTAAAIGRHAVGILVFPSIVKAGLFFGGGYGEGVLFEGGRPVSYYNSVNASWGLQAGVQSYGYVLFLMTPGAIRYLNRSDGWEIGSGPTVVVINQGAAVNLTSTTLQRRNYAFIFNQQGLMAGVMIEGTKVSQIHPSY